MVRFIATALPEADNYSRNPTACISHGRLVIRAQVAGYFESRLCTDRIDLARRNRPSLCYADRVCGYEVVDTGLCWQWCECE